MDHRHSKREINRPDKGNTHWIDYNTSTLINIIDVARDRYLDHAETMDKLVRAGGNAIINVQSARAMADNHRSQAAECKHLLEMLKRSLGFAFLHVSPEETED